MEEEKDELDTTVGFLYKTMLERDPRKRRVKPVQRHMLQLDFAGVDDSSDDSDYEFKGQKGSDSGASESEGSDNEDSESHDSSDQSESDSEGKSGDEGAGEEQEEEEEEEEEREGVEDTKSEGASTMRDELSNMGPDQELEPVEELSQQPVASAKKFKVLVCCVCLGDMSEEIDEIVECDGCQVSVHEGCYGISETQSVASTESSASTEPWFCDACKAGVKPHCELCPNFGGIYKETDAGRWVHIVCALYIPGVAFADVDKLSPVTLFEMPHTKWGAKECTLCEDERFSRTGVCISCDAGMCRAFFHVTCAQREGLLSEAAPDEDIADPFYAYCKQHADKTSARIKRRNFLAVQSNIKSKKDQDNMEEADKLRVQRKLQRHRQKYLAAKSKRPPSWVPTEKVPRLLHTSSSALRRLIRKAELLGINTQGPSSHKDIRKKWHVAPAFSTEFVSYYLDRNVRMKNMKSHQKELEAQQDKKRKQERQLRFKYDKLSQDVQRLKESSQTLRQQGEKIWKALQYMAEKPMSLPDVLKPRKVVPRSPTKKDKDIPRSPPAVIHTCGLCNLTSDQHLLAKCDKCRLFYHLGCLDPPLTRMPKKTKQFGWQCSECASSSSDSDDVQVKTNPNAPRRLRDVTSIREPSKYTPFIKEKMKKRSKRARGPVRAKKKVALKRPRKESEGPDLVEPVFSMPELKRECPSTPTDLSTLEMHTPKSAEKSPKTTPGERSAEPKPKSAEKSKTPKSSEKTPQKKPTEKTVQKSVTPKSEKQTPKKSSEKSKIPKSAELLAQLKSRPKFPVKLTKTVDKVLLAKIPDKLLHPRPAEKASQLKAAAEKEYEEKVCQKAPPRRTVKKEVDLRTECATCNRAGDNSTLVRCDECRLCYHFHCLDPPCKRSPKVRGYSWLCSACDPDSEEDETPMDTGQVESKMASPAKDSMHTTSERTSPKTSPTLSIKSSVDETELADVKVEEMEELPCSSLLKPDDGEHSKDEDASETAMPKLKQERIKDMVKGSRIEKITKALAARKEGKGEGSDDGDSLGTQTPPPPTLSPKQKLKCQLEKIKVEESAPELLKESS